jgi:hypothetical protein
MRRAATEKLVAAVFAFTFPRPGLWDYPRWREAKETPAAWVGCHRGFG